MKRAVLVILVFLLGWNSFNFYSSLAIKQQPYGGSNELNSPGDWINEDDVVIFNNQVSFYVPNARLARFADTNSMDPVIDAESNSIEIKPADASLLTVGDIISYDAEFVGSVVIHRIVKIDADEDGWYALTKGDNNNVVDPYKVRFNQIKGVVVAIFY